MRPLILLVLVVSLGCSRDSADSNAHTGGTRSESQRATIGESTIHRISVSSSFIDSIGYDPATRVLEIEMNSGRNLYQYFDVPRSAFDGIMRASSKGSYFNTSIKGAYRYRRIQ